MTADEREKCGERGLLYCGYCQHMRDIYGDVHDIKGMTLATCWGNCEIPGMGHVEFIETACAAFTPNPYASKKMNRKR